MWISVLSQAVTPAPAGAVHGIQPVTSVWDFALKGGIIMIPLGLLSVFALAMIIERIVVLRRARVWPPAFLSALRAALPDRARALDACRASGSPIAAVLAAAIRH